MQFIISETDDVLVSHSGLALAGTLLQRTQLSNRLGAIQVPGSKRPTMPHGEVLLSMLGLLCLGKSDYAAIEAFRRETFFAKSLGLPRLPSEETLRQRMDQLGTAPLDILHEESAAMIACHAPALIPCHDEYLPLDIDVSPLDNSGTKREGVAWTYKNYDGYAPAFAYLGQEGYMLHCELWPGNQHCQSGTPEFLDRAIELAKIATDAKLLVRMDAGNDDAENLRKLRKNKVQWGIKRSLRRESEAEWMEIAQAHGTCAARWQGNLHGTYLAHSRRPIATGCFSGGASHDRERRPAVADARDGNRHVVDELEGASSDAGAIDRDLSPARHV